MLKIFFFLSVVLVPSFCQDARLSRVKRVVNGDRASIQDYPFYAQLHHRDKGFLCGASILSETWLLTAAHCVVENRFPQERTVKVGDAKLGRGAAHRVSEIFVHPLYSTTRLLKTLYDYALMRLATPLKFNRRVSAVELGSREDTEDGNIATAIGLGKYGRGISFRKRVLLKGNVTLISPELCLRTLPPRVRNKLNTNLVPLYLDGVFCSRSHPPKFQSVCTGDSGGPLVVNGRLVGVSSGVPSYPQCASHLSEHPWMAYYASVPDAREWIEFFIKGKYELIEDEAGDAEEAVDED